MIKNYKLFLLVSAFFLLTPWLLVEETSARKVKNSFTIRKENLKDKQTAGHVFEGERLELNDTLALRLNKAENLSKVSFAGYDKEVGSSVESFIIVNPGPFTITGYSADIDYLDMNGRMLHSRTVTSPCLIPPGESRRFDIKTWDTQHTYYYHLGNEPKRVATPFYVRFQPLVFWIINPCESSES